MESRIKQLDYDFELMLFRAKTALDQHYHGGQYSKTIDFNRFQTSINFFPIRESRHSSRMVAETQTTGNEF